MSETFKDRSNEQLLHLKECLLYMIGIVEVELARRQQEGNVRTDELRSVKLPRSGARRHQEGK